MSEPIKWTNVTLKLSQLKKWENNPAEISKEAAGRLVECFNEFGQIETLAVDPENRLVDGHQRLDTWLAKYGDIEVDCRKASRLLTEKERQKIAVMLRSGAVGRYNWDVVSSWSADDLQGWGMDSATLKEWKHDVSALDNFIESEKKEPVDAEPQIDRAAELNEKWQVKTGDLWQIGEHRLLCGDSTKEQDINKLMGGDKAVCMWTDPPYGVEYVGKTKDALTIENDGAENLPELLSSAFLVADSILEEGAPIYVAHPAGALQMVFDKCFVDVGWRFHETLVWVKDSMVMGHSDYHYKHEPIIYGWKGKNRFWYSGRDQVSVFEIARPKRSSEHPTMKPPELVEACLYNSTTTGDITFEPFAGSGTTMVACHNIKRRCYANELSPNYCAVILERMSTAFPELEIKRLNEQTNEIN